MISKVQEFLIKEICRLQAQSLEEVFCMVELGEEKENLLIQHGATRADFDRAILDTRAQFKELEKNPENLEVLNGDSLMIFLFILSHIRERYKREYPNALNNLGKKVTQLLEV